MQKLCPLFKSPCKEHECEWYIHILGPHPQTGENLDKWGCAISWMPIFQIETAKEVRQGAAATESFRNEMVEATKMANLIRLHEVKEAKKLDGPNKDR